MRCNIVASDCIAFLDSLPADSVDLVFGSPPYEAARTYGIGFDLRGQSWVDWMVRVYKSSLRVCRGLVAFVVEGQTRKFAYSGTPLLLAADLLRAGITLRKPVVFHRVGIPGSGGPDWLRNDWEYVLCATNGGKLPWSNNTACGHPPVFPPGGAMSHRLPDGRRVLGGKTRRDKRVQDAGRSGSEQQGYVPPVLANPGNVLHCEVGGGRMGHTLSHGTEAPFPLKLAEFFVKSFCPPGGVTCDPFSGSGTTAHACAINSRNFIGSDVRESQVWLTKLRVQEVLGELSVAEAERLRNGVAPATGECLALAS